MGEPTRDHVLSKAPQRETGFDREARAKASDLGRLHGLLGNQLVGEVLDGATTGREVMEGAGVTSPFGHRDAALLRSLASRADSGKERAVQRKESGEPAPRDAAEIHRAAALGVTGSPEALPHLERIQRAFGSYGEHLRDVKAYIGGPAVGATRALGARAYTRGDAIAFRERPDLRTAAHEAAHVLQQRGGVELEEGVGEAGDRYERDADAVADAVVEGRSAEELLRGMVGSVEARPATVAVQRRDESPAPPEVEADRTSTEISVDIKGAGPLSLEARRGADGRLVGSATKGPFTINGLSVTLQATYEDGRLEAFGDATYRSDRLNGSFSMYFTDEARARSLADLRLRAYRSTPSSAPSATGVSTAPSASAPDGTPAPSPSQPAPAAASSSPDQSTSAGGLLNRVRRAGEAFNDRIADLPPTLPFPLNIPVLGARANRALRRLGSASEAPRTSSARETRGDVAGPRRFSLSPVGFGSAIFQFGEARGAGEESGTEPGRLRGTGMVNGVIEPDWSVTVAGLIQPDVGLTLLDPPYQQSKIWPEGGISASRITYPISGIAGIGTINAEVGYQLVAGFQLGPIAFRDPIIELLYSTNTKITPRIDVRGTVTTRLLAGAELTIQGSAVAAGLQVRVAELGVKLDASAALDVVLAATPSIRVEFPRDRSAALRWTVDAKLEAGVRLILALRGYVFAQILEFATRRFDIGQAQYDLLKRTVGVDLRYTSGKSPAAALVGADGFSFTPADVLTSIFRQESQRGSAPQGTGDQGTQGRATPGGAGRAQRAAAPGGNARGEGQAPAPRSGGSDEIVRLQRGLVSVPINMSGAEHTLFLSADDPPRVMLASKDPLVANDAITLLIERTNAQTRQAQAFYDRAALALSRSQPATNESSSPALEPNRTGGDATQEAAPAREQLAVAVLSGAKRDFSAAEAAARNNNRPDQPPDSAVRRAIESGGRGLETFAAATGARGLRREELEAGSRTSAPSAARPQAAQDAPQPSFNRLHSTGLDEIATLPTTALQVEKYEKLLAKLREGGPFIADPYDVPVLHNRTSNELLGRAIVYVGLGGRAAVFFNNKVYSNSNPERGPITNVASEPRLFERGEGKGPSGTPIPKRMFTSGLPLPRSDPSPREPPGSSRAAVARRR